VQALLSISRLIDAMNNRIGRTAYWLTLVAVLVSSGNATVRYLFDTSSNAWLELQWYLFSAVFLLCGGYALLHGAHVRIDVVYGRFSRRTQLWIEIVGTVLFLMPMAVLILYLSWPVFMNAFMNKEVSSNAGGLIVWPARLLLPVGFFLLVLQGLSELIKLFAILMGLIPDPALAAHGPSAEEELAQAIKEAREKEIAEGKKPSVIA
jgi:TRAP-type mannitol/chloroaromatic compound transport system permease small subunit